MTFLSTRRSVSTDSPVLRRLRGLRNSTLLSQVMRWRMKRQPLPTWDIPAATRVETRPSGGVAFVFQGGGSLTAPQVGMLRALTEAGIRPDFVIGSSAGALNAVSFANDPTLAGLDRLEQLWMLLRRKHVAPWSLRALAGALLGRADGLISNAPLRNLLMTGMVPADLDATAIPAYVVTTDVSTGEPVVLGQGDTVSALLASCAIPGFYPPVEIDGRRLVDGGVAADVPILQAEQLGAQESYVFPSAEPTQGTDLLHGPLQIALHALDHVVAATIRRDVEAAQGAVHVLPTVTSPNTNPIDFGDTANMIEQGYRLTVQWLDEHAKAAAAGTRLATSRV
ncbi:NTE family protein [Jatrophihabitans sp. GAS493]|uniref:patatin-like phospholipase family protein n=1 Tax=Jatrophihabitans sp. GAS493 TaxID=1907575 RepID=UPI000BB83290|nr:patatin-like phospholipase family protein [Jatrophihabitans sp. GAS493]SOD71676.1 NTE family protein [Jatrophihabitans sp. GAS493]